MTENHSTCIYRMSRPWKLLYTPLAGTIIGGTICAGTGLGAAAPLPAPLSITASSSTPDTSPTSGSDTHWWSLYNETGKPVYGEWSQQVGSTVSEVKITKDRQLLNGGHESRPRNDSMWWKSYWMGHICYDHLWWNMPRTPIDLGSDAAFTLRYPLGGLRAEWKAELWEPFSLEWLEINWAQGPC